MKRRKPKPVSLTKRAKGGEIRARGVLDAIHRERSGRSLYEIDQFNRPDPFRPGLYKDGVPWRE